MDFPLFTLCVLQRILPLSKSLFRIALVACCCVSYDNRHRIACLLPSLTSLHYYFVLILRVAATADLYDDGRLVERGIYTDYVIVSKETSLGIAAIKAIKAEGKEEEEEEEEEEKEEEEIHLDCLITCSKV